MNDLSSRSHWFASILLLCISSSLAFFFSCSILSVKVVGNNRLTNTRYVGKLHLIDLAGSERLSRSQATGSLNLLSQSSSQLNNSAHLLICR